MASKMWPVRVARLEAELAPKTGKPLLPARGAPMPHIAAP